MMTRAKANKIVIQLSLLGMATCAILTACSSHQPAGFVDAPGGWLPGGTPGLRSAVEPKILPKTFYAAGQLFEAQGRLSKAATQYRKATAVNHDYAAAYDRLGVTLGRLGRHPAAIEALQTAVNLQPKSAAYRNNLGFEYALQKRWDEAESELSQAVDLQPTFDRAHINLAMVLAHLQHYTEAIIEFQAVLPEADAYYNLGLLLCGQHRYADGAEAFRYVLALDSNFIAATRQLDSIGPKLALANALEPRMTIPLDTFEIQVFTSGPFDTTVETQIVTVEPFDTTETTIETQVVTNAPDDTVVETQAEMQVVTATPISVDNNTASIEADTSLISDDAPRTGSLVVVTADCFDEENPLNYDLAIESPAETNEAGIDDNTQDANSGLVLATAPMNPLPRTVMFSTVADSVDDTTPWPDVFEDSGWPCFEEEIWDFSGEEEWFDFDQPFATPGSDDMAVYDLDIESPAGGSTDAISPNAASNAAPASTHSHAEPATSSPVWNNDDTLQMPEPQWYDSTTDRNVGPEDN